MNERNNWKSLFFDFVILPLSSVVALNVNAEAVRVLAPNTARRLLPLPVVHSVDGAQVIAVIFLLVIFWVTVDAIKVIRSGRPEYSRKSAFDSRFSVCLSVPLLIADCCFFYLGVTHQNIIRSKFQFIPFLMAIAYTAATLYLAYRHLKYKEND